MVLINIHKINAQTYITLNLLYKWTLMISYVVADSKIYPKIVGLMVES